MMVSLGGMLACSKLDLDSEKNITLLRMGFVASRCEDFNSLYK